MAHAATHPCAVADACGGAAFVVPVLAVDYPAHPQRSLPPPGVYMMYTLLALEVGGHSVRSRQTWDPCDPFVMDYRAGNHSVPFVGNIPNDHMGEIVGRAFQALVALNNDVVLVVIVDHIHPFHVPVEAQHHSARALVDVHVLRRSSYQALHTN